MATGDTSWRRERPDGEAVPEAVPAATAVLVRDGLDGVEVLMARRNSRLAFAGGAWVFPGGRVDPGDWDGEPVTDLRDRRMLDAARRAAVREAAEETGAVIEADHARADLALDPADPGPQALRHLLLPRARPRPRSPTSRPTAARSTSSAGSGPRPRSTPATPARSSWRRRTFITLEHLRPFVTAAEALAFYAARRARALRHVVRRRRGRHGRHVRGRRRLRHRRRRRPRAPPPALDGASPAGATSAPGPTPEPGSARPPGTGACAPGLASSGRDRARHRPATRRVGHATPTSTGPCSRPPVAMLAEVGYEGITIEAVAHAAGVSKNAIYRRWPDKVSMVLDTLEHLAPDEDHRGRHRRHPRRHGHDAAGHGRGAARHRRAPGHLAGLRHHPPPRAGRGVPGPAGGAPPRGARRTGCVGRSRPGSCRPTATSSCSRASARPCCTTACCSTGWPPTTTT